MYEIFEVFHKSNRCNILISSVGNIFLKYSKNVILMSLNSKWDWQERRLSSENQSWRSRGDSVNDTIINVIIYRLNQSDSNKINIFWFHNENLQVVVTVHPQVSFHEECQISYNSFLIYLVFCDNLNILLFQSSKWYTLGEKRLSGSEWQ